MTKPYNHNSSFTDNEKSLLNIIKSLQHELLACQNELSQKEAQLDDAITHLNDLLSWGKSLSDTVEDAYINMQPITSN